MTTTQYPNGQTLVSSALTKDQITDILQNLTCGVLGINPPDYRAVRVNWPTQGQPFQDILADICFISAVTDNEAGYNRIRNMEITQGESGPVELWTYTRDWRVSWCLYGPASTDRARMLHSALYMDYFCDTLSASNLYPLPEAPGPVRVPELINAEWWERADFYVNMYEAVTETINDGAVESVEVKVETNDGQVADFTVNREQ